MCITVELDCLWNRTVKAGHEVAALGKHSEFYGWVYADQPF